MNFARKTAGAGLLFFAAACPGLALADTTNFSQFQSLVPTFAAIPANIVNAFVSAMPQLVSSANSTLTSPLLSFANAAIALWTMFQLFRMLSVSHANDPSKAVDLIVNRLFLYLILVSIVGSQITQVITTYIIPIFSGIISLGGQLQTGASVAGCPTGSGDYSQLSTAADQFICSTTSTFLQGVSVGVYLLENSVDGTIPFIHPFTIVAGIFLAFIYGFQLLKLPFAVIDVLFRFGMVMILLPVFIMSYLFVPTRGFFKKGVESLFASALGLLMTGIAASICASTLNSMIQSIVTSVGDTNTTSALGPIAIKDFVSLALIGLSIGSAMRMGPKIAAELVGFTGNMSGPGSATAAAIGTAAGVVSAGGAAAVGAKVAGSMSAASAAQAAGAQAGKAGDATMA